MKALDEQTLTDTTVVFFSSDNGPGGDGLKNRTRGSTVEKRTCRSHRASSENREIRPDRPAGRIGDRTALLRSTVDIARRARPTAHGFSSASRFANKLLSAETVKGLIASVLEAPFAERDRNASVELMWWGGGVVNEVKADAMAYVNRSSTTIPRVSTWWIADTPAADQKKILDWLKGV